MKKLDEDMMINKYYRKESGFNGLLPPEKEARYLRGFISFLEENGYIIVNKKDLVFTSDVR
jgi:hypothetical protein